MSVSRGPRRPILVALATSIGLMMFGTRAADAQVFKPRGKSTVATKATPAAAAAARKASSSPASPASPARPASLATPAATPSKKPTRAMGPTPHRNATTPGKKARTAGKARAGSDDDVRIDDDDDDVKITDD